VVGGFKVSSPIFQTQQFREFAIETNIGLKQSRLKRFGWRSLQDFGTV